MEFKPSKYQECVFDFTRAQVERMSGNTIEYTRLMKEISNKDFVINKNTSKNLIIEDVHHSVVCAVAGSGKTKTGKELIKLIPRNMSVVFVAFNKHIADNLKPELPQNARAMTLNAMGHGAVSWAMQQNGKRINVDAFKVNNLVRQILQTDYMNMNQEEVNAMQPVAVRIVALLKGTLLPINRESVEYLLERYTIDNEVDHEILTQICAKVMLKCKQVLGRNETCDIDFNDQLWLPVVLNLPLFQNDFVLVDEAQDMNACQLELVLKASKPTGTIIAIGDPNQSIYGFMGADVESVPKIIKRLNAIELPLSISYRCPISHVKLAQKIVPEIEPSEWAEEGIIKNIKESELIDNVVNGDLIICRYNAPLVKPCFQLIRAGKKATIKGRDIGTNLITLIRKIKGTSMREFLVHLKEWKNKEKSKCESSGKSSESIMDKYETILVLSEECDDTNCLIQKIQTIFSDDISAIQLSSIHKAKGLEANNVGILKPSLIPSCYANASWEFEQERNLKYVALTRAKKSLMMIE